MGKRLVVVWMTLLLALIAPGIAYAQYDFDAILSNLPARLDVVTVDNWSTGAQVWQYVVPNPSGSGPWGQLSATFTGQDHTGDGIDDDDHLALLEQILNDDPCARALLGGTKMDAIQAAFAANKAHVQDFEMTICLEILSSTEVNARIDTGFIGCISLTNPSISMANTYVTTGSPATLPLRVYGIAFNQDVDIPSLWGEDGVLEGAGEGFGEDLANLLAAYLTIGDQNNVDYMQGLIAQTVARGVLPNIAIIIIAAIQGKENPDKAADLVDEALLEALLSEKAYDEKNYNLPSQGNIDIDVSFDPYYRVPIGDGCGGPDSEYIDLKRVVARVLGSCVENGIEGWLHNYVVNSNGFTGYPAWLAGGGDLNEDTITNISTYNNNSGNREGFLVGEETAYPVMTFNPQA